MAYVFNIAKGRVVEYYNRVISNDPTNSALVLVPLSVAGTKAQGQTLDTLALVLAHANFTEQTGGGWVRKVLTNAEIEALPSPDDLNNWYDVRLPSVTWVTPATGSDTVGLLVCYDLDTTGGTDANIIPLTYHEYAVTATDVNVILSIGDFFRGK